MLINYRKLEGNIAAIQKVIYAVDIVKIYNLHLSSGGEKLLIAYLGPEHLISSYEPCMEIADRIGIPFKLFTDLKKAREWLQI